MKNTNRFGVVELSPSEKRTVEGGALNFEPMHIYMPKYPIIIVPDWNTPIKRPILKWS